MQDVAALAHQAGPPDRLADLAVAHQVALVDREVEFSGDRVDTAAAHVLGVQAVLHGGDDILVPVGTGGDIGVGHPGGGGIGVALAAGTAGGGHSHPAAVELIHQIAFQHPVFDEHILLSRGALVVDVHGTPGVGDGAVINGGDLFIGNLLAQLSGELRTAVGNAGSLQRVTAGLVEDHAAEAVFNGHRHNTGGAVACSCHGDGLPCRLQTHLPGRNVLKHFQTLPASGAAVAGLGFAAAFRHSLDQHPGADLTIPGVQALGVGNLDAVIHLQHGAADLGHRRIILSGGKIAFLQNGHLFPVGNAGGHDLHRMDIRKDPLPQDDVHGSRSLPQSTGGLLGAGQKPCLAGIHGRSHDTSQAPVHPDSRAHHIGVFNGIHRVGDHVNGMVLGVFRKNLRIVAPGRQGLLQHTAANISGNHSISPSLILVLIWYTVLPGKASLPAVEISARSPVRYE